jgi:putative Holliday junction resolvase
MPVFLGVDLGEKRVGVARSDETGTIAEAFATFTYLGKKDLARQLKEFVETCRPAKVVVGLPTTLRGEEGPAAKKVIERVDWLRTQVPAEWVLWDERLTTAEAERILLEAGLSRSKRREVRDRLAAQRILQSYLDAVKHV